MPESRIDTGRRVAILSVAVSAALAILNVTVGILSGSTSVVAAGLEFAGDVLASLIVYLGMLIASRPADEDHPYGHGRFEILAGLLVGFILILAGASICALALSRVGEIHNPPGTTAIWALGASMVVKGTLGTYKFRIGRWIGSAALVADAWNDTVDLVSAVVALAAVALARYDPGQFMSADQYGGFAVGTIVVLTGVQVVRNTALELTDTMPGAHVLGEIRQIAFEVSGVEGVEKCFARKTGLQYHVDLHIEVDPSLTVAESHYLAHRVQAHICRRVPSVAGVLVHVEPAPARRTEAD